MLTNQLYNPLDWYWFVAGDMSKVWSSSRLAYVTPSDAPYQAWLALGNVPTIIDSATSLAGVMQDQVIPFFFNAGITVTSISVPSINATYGLDQTTLNQIGTVARDVASGIGLPLGSTTFAYPDKNGSPKTLYPQNIIDLYQAMRNYIASSNYAMQALVMGGSATMPNNNVTIP